MNEGGYEDTSGGQHFDEIDGGTIREKNGRKRWKSQNRRACSFRGIGYRGGLEVVGIHSCESDEPRMMTITKQERDTVVTAETENGGQRQRNWHGGPDQGKVAAN